MKTIKISQSKLLETKVLRVATHSNKIILQQPSGNILPPNTIVISKKQFSLLLSELIDQMDKGEF